MNEQERVLKLLEDKKITAEEAARLLDALKQADTGHSNRFLKVRVWKTGYESPRVNITLPIALFRWGLKMVPESAKAKVEGHEVDLKIVSEALERGITGKIVDVQDDEKGEHVEVWLE